MTKSIEPKKLVVMIMKIIVVIVVIVVLWCFYSLIRFEEKFTPWYVYGVSNPYEYYQKHIGALLLENGKQYDLKLSIDENNPETYNVYRDEEHNFEFKYPKGFYVKVNNTFFGDTGTIIEVFKNGDNSKQCTIDVLYKGWGVGRNWLPRERLFMENYIKKGNATFYLLTKQGQIVHTNSGGDSNSTLTKDKGGLINYINPNKQNEIVDVSFGCKKNEINIINDIITTFQFVE